MVTPTPPKWRCAAGLAWALLIMAVAGCSGNVTIDRPEVDVSQLPPAQQAMAYAAQGDLSRLKAVLDADPTVVEARGESGRTPLHFAAANGQAKVVDYLLERGANPETTDDNGQTPATAALEFNHQAVADRLIEASRQHAGGP